MRAGSPADEMPPNDALILHWKRSVWVIHMWHQCLQNRVELLPITHYGWAMDGGTLKIVWDSQKNIEEVKKRILYYTSGCRCHSGELLCSSIRCGCVCKGQECGPACKQCEDRCVNTGQTQRNPSSPTLDISSDPTLEISSEDAEDVLSSDELSSDEELVTDETGINDPNIQQIMSKFFK